MRTSLRQVLLSGLLLALLAACSSDSGEEAGGGAPTGGAFTDLPDAPLTARNDAVLATVGDEVIVFGGDDYTCPPTADCALPDRPPFNDDAAFNVAARTWRPIADVPTGVHAVRTATIGTTVYALVQCEKLPRCPTGNTTLSYDVITDEWIQLAGVPGEALHQVSAVDGELFAISNSDELSLTRLPV